MRKFLMVGVLALAGCASVGQTPLTNDQKVKMGCASAGAALKVLAVARKEDKLSAEQVERVTEAVTMIAPICGAETTPNLSDVKLALFDELVEVIVDEAKKED